MAIDSELVRRAIAEKMSETGETAYSVSVSCEGHPTPESIKRFLRGTSELRADLVSRVMSCLGLVITDEN